MLEKLLVEKLTALADDEVVLAQRLSEWVAHAPILEEDIAIANLAQDELGHAKLYLNPSCYPGISWTRRLRLWAKMKESTLITKPFWVTAWMRRGNKAWSILPTVSTTLRPTMAKYCSQGTYRRLFLLRMTMGTIPCASRRRSS